MGEARRNLAPVLGVDGTAVRERDRIGGSRLTSADVTTGSRAREIPDSVGERTGASRRSVCRRQTTGFGAR